MTYTRRIGVKKENEEGWVEWNKPEKQEEWRERLKGLLEIYKDKDNDADEDDVADFISQLLSERTPSKEDITGAVARGYTYKVNENKVLDVDLCKAIVEEISKLLKKEE